MPSSTDETKDDATAAAGPDTAAATPEETPARGRKAPACPVCAGPLAVYTGGDINPHKVGTGFCERCGARYPLKG